MKIPTQALLAQRLCLYDVEWQILRVSLLGKWDTNAGSLTALRQLETYVWLDAKNTNEDVMASRLHRCINLMNTVRMSWYGSNKIDSVGDIKLIQVHDAMQCAYDNFNYKANTKKGKIEWEVPTAEQIRNECAVVPIRYVEAVLKDLNRCFTFAVYKTKGATKEISIEQVNKNLPELVWAKEAYYTALVNHPYYVE
jgi:hypothetical protein